MIAIDADVLLMPAEDLIALWEDLRGQRPTPFRAMVFAGLEQRVKHAGPLECPRLGIAYRWSVGAGSVDRWKMPPCALAQHRRQERLAEQHKREKRTRAKRKGVA